MARNASQRQIVGVAQFSAFGAAVTMAIAMGTSYMTQALFLSAHHADWASWAVPLTIDVLAVMSNLALGLPTRKGFGKGGLWTILLVALSFSMWLNFAAGVTFIASTAHVWVVLAYLAAEYVRGWVKRYRAALEDEIEEATTATQAAAAPEPAPVEVAKPKTTRARTAAPRQRKTPGVYVPVTPTEGLPARAEA